ncbi:hypothetical protein J3E68DRAFT_425504 [Trichoderma sp. SZMC 28012]
MDSGCSDMIVDEQWLEKYSTNATYFEADTPNVMSSVDGLKDYFQVLTVFFERTAKDYDIVDVRTREMSVWVYMRAPNVRRKIRDSASMMRYYLGKMESRWKEKAYREVRQELLEKQTTMAEQQTKLAC